MQRAVILGGTETGRAGKFLRAELLKAGVKRYEVKEVNSILDNDYVLALGKEAFLRVTTGNPDFGTHRGTLLLYPLDKTLIIPTYHPSFVLRRPSLLPIFRHDLGLFSAILEIDGGTY